MKIIFLGKPGSGKGTYAQMLSQELKIPKFVMGDLLREEIKKGTRLGKEIASYIDKGNLAPAEIVVRIITSKIKNKKNFIIDGFPRSLEQLNLFKENIDIVFYLNCYDKEIIKRLINRRTCTKCNRVYNLITNPPKEKGKCDVCGGKLIIRKDETKEGIKQRLRVYKKETFPVIEHYRKKGVLIEIDGNKPINVVYKKIKSYLKNLNLI